MKKKNKKGFTIVELVIVIAVIAILAAVLIPTFTSVTDRAKESAALQEARNAYTVITVYDIEEETNDVGANYLIEVDGYYFKVKNGVLGTTPVSADVVKSLTAVSFDITDLPDDIAIYR